MIPLTIAPMRAEHLDHVMAIERVAFPTHWSRTTFERELATNKLGHYWVIQPHKSATTAASALDPPPAVLCYGGFWLTGEEIHIVSVATHPQWRKRGLAKRLMRHILIEASDLGAIEATLEVRVSNTAARRLYGNMGFIKVGQRKNYYPPTELLGSSEDALLLTLFELNETAGKMTELLTR